MPPKANSQLERLEAHARGLTEQVQPKKIEACLDEIRSGGADGLRRACVDLLALGGGCSREAERTWVLGDVEGGWGYYNAGLRLMAFPALLYTAGGTTFDSAAFIGLRAVGVGDVQLATALWNLLNSPNRIRVPIHNTSLPELMTWLMWRWQHIGKNDCSLAGTHFEQLEAEWKNGSEGIADCMPGVCRYQTEVSKERFDGAVGVAMPILHAIVGIADAEGISIPRGVHQYMSTPYFDPRPKAQVPSQIFELLNQFSDLASKLGHDDVVQAVWHA